MPWIYSWMPAFEHFSVGLSSRASPLAATSDEAQCSDPLWSHLWIAQEKKKKKTGNHASTWQPQACSSFTWHLGSSCRAQHILQPDPVDTGGVGAPCTPVQYVRRPKLWVVYWNPVVTAVQAHSEEKNPKRGTFPSPCVLCGLFAFTGLQMSKSVLFARILSLKAGQCPPPRLRLHGRYPVCLVFCVYANDSQAHDEIRNCNTITVFYWCNVS